MSSFTAIQYPFLKPDDSLFSWANQGAAAIDSSNGFLAMTVPSAAAQNARVRYKAAPTAPYRLTVCLNWDLPPVNYSGVGIGWRDSATGELALNRHYFDGGSRFVDSIKYNSPTSYNSHYDFDIFNTENQGLIFAQLEDDATNRIIRFGSSGFGFSQYHSIGRTDFLNPDQLCWVGFNDSTGVDIIANLLSWKEELL